MKEFLDILLDALIDTAKLAPFLFAAYLLLEYLEHRSSSKLANFLTNGKFGVPSGAVLGCIPQCGMSVAVSHLFSAGAVGAGTLVAVFVSCSDEAIPVLLADFRHLGSVVPLLLSKVAFAVVAGYLFDIIFRRHKFGGGHHEHEHDCDECDKIEEAHHHHCGEKCDSNVFLSALKRSVEVILFILAVNIIMGLLVHFAGEDAISAFAQKNKLLQPLFAALIGITALSKEERDRTAEFLLTHPVSRSHVTAQKLLAVMAQVVILNAAVVLVAVLATLAIGESIDGKLFFNVFLGYLLMQLEIACVTFGLSAFIRGGGIGIGLGLAFVLYFMNILANLTDSAEFLRYITPFSYADGTAIVSSGAIEVKYLIPGIAYALIGVAAAFIKYERKDIRA